MTGEFMGGWHWGFGFGHWIIGVSFWAVIIVALVALVKSVVNK